MARYEFTSRAYARSHGKEPRGRGVWAFQRATAVAAFDYNLTGPVLFTAGPVTLSQAKAWIRTEQPAGLYAILP